MNKQLDLLQGTLDMLILKAASLGPLQGYGKMMCQNKNINCVGMQTDPDTGESNSIDAGKVAIAALTRVQDA